MRVGDKVKVIVKDSYFMTMGFRERYGKVYHINKHLITVLFTKNDASYRESFRKADLLAKGWVDMELKQGKEWIKVNKEVLSGNSRRED